MAGGAVGGEVVLPRLDVVLRPAARAVEPLVEVLGAAPFQIGHDKAGVGALGSCLDPGDDALDSAPAAGGIVELREAPYLAALGRRPEALGGGCLQRSDMTAQCRIGGEAEHPIDAVGATPIEEFGRGIMAVGAQQDLDPGPQGADSANQTAHKGSDLAPARPLAGPQQRGHESSLAVEDDNRLEAVIIMIGVE